MIVIDVYRNGIAWAILLL